MIAILQWTSSADPEVNLAYLKEQIAALREQYNAPELLVCLPEGFACFDAGSEQVLKFSKRSDAFIAQICSLAETFNIWINAGTIPIASGNKYYAASLLINNIGKVVSRYNKIHLFDVDVEDNTKRYRESDTTLPGTELVVTDTPFGKLGLTVCYDLRFPALFGKLRELGAEVILVPSAFTVPTGQAHWQSLIRARAIENQVFIVAAATTGCHDNGRETYGHSLVVDPWGKVVAQLGREEGNIVYLPEMAQLAEIRNNMPITRHNQFNYEFKHEQ